MKLKTILLLLAMAFSGCNRESGRPNVLLIIADDLGWTDLSAYGSSFYETPNLDQLAGGGVKFTNAYANCPVCSPSRASFQTGKFSARTGVTDWIRGRKAGTGATPGDRWIGADTKFELGLEEITIAEALKENGYQTFFAGKWHLGETEQYWPEFQGYDINKGGWSKGSPQRGQNAKGYFVPYGNPRLPDGPEGEYLPDRLATETIGFIESKKDQPFFVCLSFYLVHNPMQGKDEIIQKYREKRQRMGLDTAQEMLADQEWIKYATTKSDYKERIIQGNPVYAAMMESLDVNIGRVIESLKENKLYENTLILFVSDNGGLSTAEGSPTSNLPLRAGKGWLYEGGIRVPFIIKVPGSSPKAQIVDYPVSGADIFPTIMKYTGTVVNSDIDGWDLSPLIQGSTLPERPLFWHYPHYSNQGGEPGSAIRLGDFKLIHDFETGRKQLYNLKADIGEKNDLSHSMPELRDKLYKALDDWRKANNVKMLTEPNKMWNGLGP